MFFSQNDTLAHIWCAETDNPLVLARREDFPGIWSRLDVGGIVDVTVCTQGDGRFVERLEIVDLDAG